MSDDLQKDLEKVLANIVACMRMEGFEVTEETIEKARGILKGDLDADVEVAKVVEQYKSSDGDIHSAVSSRKII